MRVSPASASYKDERIQNLHQQNIVGLLTRIVGQAGLNRWTGKKVMLLTNWRLPDITDRPETLLFDWEDFEIAGGLDKLPEVIAARQRFEADSANLTAKSSRQEVERVLGCSARKANRILKKLRGGQHPAYKLPGTDSHVSRKWREKSIRNHRHYWKQSAVGRQ